MKKLVKNNVLPVTFATVTALFFSTYNADVNSISGLWHTDHWLLYVTVLSTNGILFMIGDNQITNKIAGMLLLIVVLFPTTIPKGFIMADLLHYIAAISFYIVKSLNHRKYDVWIIIIGGTVLYSAGLHLYTIEIIGLYILILTGYLKKKNYFKAKRTELKRIYGKI